MHKSLFIILLFAGILQITVTGQTNNSSKLIEWIVSGITRKAMVYVATALSQKPMSIIFAFHGHGGTMGSHFYLSTRLKYPWSLNRSRRQINRLANGRSGMEQGSLIFWRHVKQLKKRT